MPRVYRISIHALLAESDGINRVKRLLPTWISIHALLAESDDNYIYNVSIGNISIHALLAESDGSVQVSGVPSSVFLSTLSLRRATLLYAMGHHRHCDFYPTLLAESDLFDEDDPDNLWSISIHALLAESDWQAAKALDRLRISIHALLAESDLDHGIALVPHQHFYPRSPCGERLSSPNTDIIILDISIHALLAESDRCNGGDQS